MKLRNYLNESIDYKHIKNIINMIINNDPENFNIKNYKIKTNKKDKGIEFVYPKKFMDLTIALVGISDTLNLKFKVSEKNENSIFLFLN